MEIHASIFLNDILFAYGAPALLACFGAHLFHKRDDLASALISLFGAAGLGVMLTGLEVHHGFHGGVMTETSASLNELATYSIVWGAVAAALIGIGRMIENKQVQTVGRGYMGLSLASMLIGPLLVGNPLWNHTDVGSVPIVNGILYSFGVTTALAVLAAWDSMRTQSHFWARINRAVALVMGFAFLTLQVRQGFQGNFLDVGAPSNAEWFAYSAAWIVFAGVLLTIGLMSQSKVLRLASMAVMFAAVLKVFLFDTRQLQDEWRVLSYFGLGVSLLTLAWVYQKFVFKSRSA
jgi:uncharacterized membrane protein